MLYLVRELNRSVDSVTRGMREVQKGNLDVVVPVTGKDEIAEISTTFNDMTARIKQLIREVQDVMERKKNAEIRALEAQITPHFLYNTLDSVSLLYNRYSRYTYYKEVFIMRVRSLPLEKVKIQDQFWSERIDLVRNVIIPYQWDAINDRIEDAESSHSLENFKIAAGLAEGEFYGAVFQDTDVAKWLEAVGFTLECFPDEELEKTADEVIDIIEKAQCPDGYINTYFTIKEPEKRWSDLCEGHELYTAGHLMEAAVSYYHGTGKDKFLKCMCRFADLICQVFGDGEGQIHGYPGHQEVEIGLIKLYETTGERRYLDQAKYFIDARGVWENYFLKEMARPDYKMIFPEFDRYDTKYSQSHMPVREQKTAEGHAVRAVYMYCAMADLAWEYQDEELMQACRTLWENMVQKRMYITGGIGSSGILERFTTDYDLPNSYNYSESCASIGLALFGLRMAQITKESRYMDVAERALYNTVLAGIALDGKSFFYVNPLEVWPPACMDRTSREHIKPVRQKWFGVACCPPNIARTLASLGQYIYGWDEGEKSLYLNLFVSNKTKINTAESHADIEMETRFPWENKIMLRVKNVKGRMKIKVRVPDYAENFRVIGNGEIIHLEKQLGYAVLNVSGDAEYKIAFECPPKFYRANPLVRADVGKTALVRGPIVYCLEETDNGSNLSALYVDTSKEIKEERDGYAGTVVLKAKGARVIQDSWTGELYSAQKPETEETELTAVPYFCWNNRGEGEMTVWIKEL